MKHSHSFLKYHSSWIQSYVQFCMAKVCRCLWRSMSRKYWLFGSTYHSTLMIRQFSTRKSTTRQWFKKKTHTSVKTKRVTVDCHCHCHYHVNSTLMIRQFSTRKSTTRQWFQCFFFKKKNIQINENKTGNSWLSLSLPLTLPRVSHKEFRKIKQVENFHSPQLEATCQ